MTTDLSPRTLRTGDVDSPGSPARSGRRSVDFAVATLVSAAAVLLGFLLDRNFSVGSLALVFLCAVVVVAVRTGVAAAVYAALLCFLAYNFFFTAPRFTFRIKSVPDVIAVFAFLAVALIVGQLAAREHAQVLALRAANEFEAAQRRLGRVLATATDEAGVLGSACAELGASLEAEVVALQVRDDARGFRQIVADPPGTRLTEAELQAAMTVSDLSAQELDRRPDLASSWRYFPLAADGEVVGVIALRHRTAGRRTLSGELELVEALARQTAEAAMRTRLVESLEAARLENETERIRAALLASVSHDLRTPLAAIIGASSSLAAYGDSISEDDRSSLLEAIRAEAQRLDRYIQNLLDMTRLGSGPLAVERQWIDLGEVVGSATERLLRSFPGATVETQLPIDLPPLFVHPALLEQALFNVFENAARFSPERSPVVLRAHRDGDSVLIDVVDRGPGVPEMERRQIFETFYSAARGDRGSQGTGLGLAIVRGMIGAHGGSVEALPGDGGVGTTIRIRLPLVEPPRAAGEESA